MSSCANHDDDERKLSPLMTAFVLTWVFLGLLAFYQSLRCFSKSGSAAEKIFGFLLALTMGPLYFLFSHENPNYCQSK